MDEKLEPLLSVEKAAKLCSVSIQLLYREMKNGNLPFKKIGRLRRIRERDLNVWLDQQQGGSK